MKKKEIAAALLKVGAKCAAVGEATARRGDETVDLTPFYHGAAEAFGIALLALRGEVGADALDPGNVMASIAEHYLSWLDEGGEDE